MGTATGSAVGAFGVRSSRESRPPTMNIEASIGRATRRTRVMWDSFPSRGRRITWVCPFTDGGSAVTLMLF